MGSSTVIRKTIELADGSGKLVLFEGPTGQTQLRQENLAYINSAGEIAWRAELPRNTYPDWFVEVRVEDDTIKANTWSCFFVTLDRETGKILTSVFTK